jgi:hypothetical protein
MITTEDLSITGNLKVAGGNVTLPNIAVGGATIGANALAVAGDVTITGNTLLTGNLSMNGLTSSFVSGNVTIGSVATSTGNALTVGGSVGITGNISLKGGTLSVINGNLTLNGNTVGSGSIIASNIAIGGATIGSNALAVSGNTTLSGGLTVTGTLTLPNSSVTNVMLSNNSITIAGTAVSLGGSISQATICSGYATTSSLSSYATTAGASHTGTTTFNTSTVINNSGYIGVGTTTPTVPIYISAIASFYSGGAQSFTSGGVTTSGGGNRSTSLYCSGWAVADTFTTSSDERIKKFIQGIDDNQALSLLRLIKPKTFQYIDQVKHGPAPVYGFIAQEVGEILPFAVNTMCNFIPNIFEGATVTNGNIVTLTNVSTTSFVQDACNNIVKIKAYDLSNNEILTNIIKIIDDKSFQVDVDIESPQLFVYGQQVSDFYSLEKDAIFTITTAVVQQIDREFQEAKQTIRVQQSQIQDLQSQISGLHTQLINVLDRLSTMDLQR